MEWVQDHLIPLLRWIHVLSAGMWTGLLWFLAWIHPGPEEEEGCPGLLSRLFEGYRWSSGVAWASGLLLVGLVYYHQGLVWERGASAWNPLALLLILLTFTSVHIYDFLVRRVLRHPLALLLAGLALSLGSLHAFESAGFGLRGRSIHLGVIFGSCMGFNAWFRVLPAQRKIFAALQAGERPPEELRMLVRTRLRQSTFFSLPAVLLMIHVHAAAWMAPPYRLALVLLPAWLLCAGAHGIAERRRRP